jgi:hypothetical protein
MELGRRRNRGEAAAGGVTAARGARGDGSDFVRSLGFPRAPRQIAFGPAQRILFAGACRDPIPKARVFAAAGTTAASRTRPPDLMTLVDILALTLAATSGWLLWDSLKTRELANAAMRAACRNEGLLFLDDTVALESLRPARDAHGRMRLRRVFAFEYSDTGHNRRKGRLTMLGDDVRELDVGPRPVPDAAALH